MTIQKKLVTVILLFGLATGSFPACGKLEKTNTTPVTEAVSHEAGDYGIQNVSSLNDVDLKARLAKARLKLNISPLFEEAARNNQMPWKDYYSIKSKSGLTEIRFRIELLQTDTKADSNSQDRIVEMAETEIIKTQSGGARINVKPMPTEEVQAEYNADLGAFGAVHSAREYEHGTMMAVQKHDVAIVYIFLFFTDPANKNVAAELPASFELLEFLN